MFWMIWESNKNIIKINNFSSRSVNLNLFNLFNSNDIKKYKFIIKTQILKSFNNKKKLSISTLYTLQFIICK
jgi:hypothetical protein